MLTVAKLIDQLSKLPQEAEVIVIEPGDISTDGNDYYSEISRVGFRKRLMWRQSEDQEPEVKREKVVALRLKSWF